jgi:hypothetical protein
MANSEKVRYFQGFMTDCRRRDLDRTLAAEQGGDAAVVVA